MTAMDRIVHYLDRIAKALELIAQRHGAGSISPKTSDESIVLQAFELAAYREQYGPHYKTLEEYRAQFGPLQKRSHDA